MATRIGRGLQGQFLNLSSVELGGGKSISGRSPIRDISAKAKRYASFKPEPTRPEPKSRGYKIAKFVAITSALLFLALVVIILVTQYREDQENFLHPHFSTVPNPPAISKPMAEQTTSGAINSNAANERINDTPKGMELNKTNT